MQQVFGFLGAPKLWQAMGDPVMGGVSVSRMQPIDDNISEFSGDVSLVNGGGFASVTYRFELPLCLPEAQGVMLRASGDGKYYKLGLRTQAERLAPIYQHPLSLQGSGWETVQLSFVDFVASRRGQVVPDALPLNGCHIVALSLYISGRQAGPFALQLSDLVFY